MLADPDAITGRRVLHIQRAAGIAGSERHLLTLLPALRRAGVDARLCVLVTREGARFVTAARDAGIPVTETESRGHGDPRQFARLLSLIRRLQPDLVHTHLIDADIHGQIAARLSRTPA